MLPQRRERRLALYERMFAAGADLHGALESLAVRTPEDVARLEDILAIQRFAADFTPPVREADDNPLDFAPMSFAAP